MRETTTKRLSRQHVVQALTIAIATAGVITLWQSPARALVAIAGRGVANPGPPVAPPLNPDKGPPGEPGVAPNPNDRDPGNLMDQAAQSNMPVYVDDSFSSVDKIRTAKLHAKQEQWQLAINEFQAIVDTSGQKLVYLNDGSYVSITDYVRQNLLQMAAVKNGMYDQLFGGTAQTLVDNAIQKHDVAGLIRTCDRYFPSTAAMKGLQQAAEWYFENGEFEAAARVWVQLLDHPMAAKLKPDLMFRAATAESLARNKDSATAMHDRLEKEFPDATGLVSGQDVKLLDKLNDVLKLPAWDGVDIGKDEWPAFGGGPGRSRLLQVNATIGARLWATQFAGDSSSAAAGSPTYLNDKLNNVAIATAYGGPVNVDAGGMVLNSFPVLSNGTLFIHGGNRVMAISANAGTQLWSYPANAGAQVMAAQAQQAALLRSRGIITRNMGHDSVSVYGDQVFAMLPAGNAGAQPVYDEYSGNLVTNANARVVCLSRDDGKELWSVSADQVKLDTVGALTFVGSPTVTRQGVFVMARRGTSQSFNQQYLVRLDRATGAVSWSCYLCSTTSLNTGYNLANAGAMCVPTIADDVVYMCTGQGADCAVDANAGRILWLRVVDDVNAQDPNGNVNFNGNLRGGRMQIATSANLPAWKLNPPLITGDRMIATDSGAYLRVYDRWSGKLINSIKANDLGLGKVDILAGVLGSHVIMTGASKTISVDVEALEKKGAPITPNWEFDPSSSEMGAPAGRPFLTADAYYIPFEKKLVRINPNDHGLGEPWPWPKTDQDQPGKPGNLLVTSEQVVVVNDAEVAGYSKWETARDNRLEKIKARPSDPEPCLDLAEISFRTNNGDFAHEYMKKAVDLANQGEAAGGGGSKPMASLLKRLYQTNLNFALQLLGKDDKALRDDSRFYFEQCKSSARDPEQQAEWRLRMADLSLKQQRPDEAATLYSEVLADPLLRAASYREADQLEPAGATAQDRMSKLIKENRDVYKRFEDQASGLLAKARNGHDTVGLQQVIDAYPNSDSAVQSAVDLVGLYLDKQDWEHARRTLWWLEPKAQGEAQARAIADLVTVSVQLQRFHTAAAWIGKGERNFKDLKFTSSEGKQMTFADIRKKVAASGVPDIEGRLPGFKDSLISNSSSLGTEMLANGNVIDGKLLAPVETSTLLRQSNLLFVQSGNKITIRDTAKDSSADVNITLPNGNDAILLGATPQRAVLLQKDTALAIDIPGKKVAWSQHLDPMAALPANQPINGGNGAVTLNNNGFNGQIIVQGGGVLVINGQAIQANGGNVAIVNGQLVPVNGLINDGTGRAIGMQSVGDPESSRAMAILSLGQSNFTTARIISNRLVILAGNKLFAYDIDSGAPAWHDRNNNLAKVTLPDGAPTSLAGNDDVVVVQIDGPDGKSLFDVVDTDTGQPRKQIKLEGGIAEWRAVGDDGTLFVVTQQVVAAYDLVGDGQLPIWQRKDIQTRFGSATQLTLDGLMIVDNNLNAMCLAQESGEKRWSAEVRLAMDSAGNSLTTLRSIVDGDSVIYQSEKSGIAVKTTPDASQIVWRPTYGPKTPTLVGMELSDTYIVELAMGQLTQPGITDMEQLIIRARKGGKLTAAVNLPSQGSGRLMNWQVVDGGIALDIVGNGEQSHVVHFWKAKPDPAKP